MPISLKSNYLDLENDMVYFPIVCTPKNRKNLASNRKLP